VYTQYTRIYMRIYTLIVRYVRATYACIHIYMHYIRGYTHTHALHTRVYLYTCAHTRTYTLIARYTCATCVYTHIHAIYIHIHAHIRAYTCILRAIRVLQMRVYSYTCAYTHTYVQIECYARAICSLT
jgi:hypothetical protein